MKDNIHNALKVLLIQDVFDFGIFLTASGMFNVNLSPIYYYDIPPVVINLIGNGRFQFVDLEKESFRTLKVPNSFESSVTLISRLLYEEEVDSYDFDDILRWYILLKKGNIN